MSGQEGWVDIQTSEARDGECVVGQKQSVCCDYYSVRSEAFQAFSRRGVFSQRRGLEDWKSSMPRKLLHWWRGAPASSTGAPVGLSEYAYDVVARFNKCGECRDRECGRTHENDTKGLLCHPHTAPVPENPLNVTPVAYFYAVLFRQSGVYFQIVQYRRVRTVPRQVGPCLAFGRAWHVPMNVQYGAIGANPHEIQVESHIVHPECGRTGVIEDEQHTGR